MNSQLTDFARSELKVGLAQLPESWQHLFKRMYGHPNIERDINIIVDTMPDEKLDRAMEQVSVSLKKFESAPKAN